MRTEQGNGIRILSIRRLPARAAKESADEQNKIRQSDAEKLWKLLDGSPFELSSVVIHLAWRCGLGRHAIWNLQREEVGFEGR